MSTIQNPSTCFTTNKIQLAAFLIAGKHLPFLGCKPSQQPGVVSFVFEDAKAQAATLEHQFETGAVAPARDLFAAHRLLIKEIDRTRRQGVR